MDDAGAAGAAAQVYAWVLDFVLQQLVELPAQLLHQLSHLGNTHIHRAKLIYLCSLALSSNIVHFIFFSPAKSIIDHTDSCKWDYVVCT